ncbi:MAG: acyl-CoA dehydrogenase C-terminal domain-containing protein [Syntrophales bacterium LBB04]|nr:acyl-CoA dehydrogenase C-terminal domain-containing protein [Syntrophales bacterium LBB04]
MLLIQEIEETIATAKEETQLQPYARELEEATDRLKKVTAHLVSLAMQGKVDLFLADSTLYLEFFGIITIGWQWLLQAITAEKALRKNSTGTEMNFYQGKLYTFRYFFQYELPKIEGLAKSLLASSGITVDMKKDFF